MDQPKLPNFFVVGAPKAGTTSLHRYLSQHPEIYMSPVKEPCFFASEIRPPHISAEMQRRLRVQSRALPQHIHDGKPFDPLGWLSCDWDQYLRLFQGVSTETAIGEASAAYLWSETAARNIHERIPDARIVMILRDPAERAFSHYLHQLAVGLTRATFREHIELCARGGHTELGPLYPFLETGFYAQQVQRYLELFPRERVRIYWYEEAWRPPARLFDDLFAFLRVAPFTPDTSRKSLERRAPKWAAANYFLHKLRIWEPAKRLIPGPLRPYLRAQVFRPGDSLTMDSRDRQYLVDYYREDIRKLALLLDRDLSAWLR